MVKKNLFVMLLVIPTMLFAQNTERGSSAFNKPRGYMGQVAVRGGMGLGNDFTDVSLSVINGFRFSPQFAMGLGVGLRASICGRESTTYYCVPVFLHLRSDFFNRRVSPFVALNLTGLDFGYKIFAANANHNPQFLEIILGCSFNVGQRHRMSVGLNSRNVGYGGSLGLSVGFSW